MPQLNNQQKKLRPQHLITQKSNLGTDRKQEPNLEIAGYLNVADGGQRRKVPIGAERSLREHSVLKDLVGDEHVGELPHDLLGHHLHSPLVRHAPNPNWVPDDGR